MFAPKLKTVVGQASKKGTRPCKSNDRRQSLIVRNTSVTETLNVGLDGDATTNVFSIAPGGYWEPQVAPSNEIWLASASNVACAFWFAEG